MSEVKRRRPVRRAITEEEYREAEAMVSLMLLGITIVASQVLDSMAAAVERPQEEQP